MSRGFTSGLLLWEVVLFNLFPNILLKLQARQKELGDKLDLASFLIKPVQRMGKYGLLLRVSPQ